MDSDVDNFKSTQTSVMRVTEGLARFGTKRSAVGAAVDGMADGAGPAEGAADGAGSPGSVGEKV